MKYERGVVAVDYITVAAVAAIALPPVHIVTESPVLAPPIIRKTPSQKALQLTR